jgi:hypothetical protein
MFELDQPGRLFGARVVASGFDVALHVTIPGTVVRFRARQQQPADYDRTTSLKSVIAALATDDLDELKPDPPEIVDGELAAIDLPPITGWRVHRVWPDQMISLAIAETCRLIGVAVGDFEAAAGGFDPRAHRYAVERSSNDLLHTVLQAPVMLSTITDRTLVVPGRVVFSALILGLPTRGWRSRDLGRWQALSIENVDVLVATTEPSWVV